MGPAFLLVGDTDRYFQMKMLCCVWVSDCGYVDATGNALTATSWLA